MDAYIYDGRCTPFGRYGGVLSGRRPDDLLAGVVKKVVKRSPFDPEAFIVGTRPVAERAGAKPLARILAVAIAGVEPRTIGLGPVPATEKVLARAGLGLGDMDAIEINEAFAAQVLGCTTLLQLSDDDSRLNPNGGDIAIRHPLGASGARLALTAALELRRRGGRHALVTMCIGIGQGISVVLERAGSLT